VQTNLVSILSVAAVFWLAWNTLWPWLSGWFRLTAEYPDQEDAPILRLRYQSGKMRFGTNLRGTLSLSACPLGLRVSMIRIFGPFCSPFEVPWSEIKIRREEFMFWSFAILEFGNPLVGRLTISDSTAKQLAAAAAEFWPDASGALG